MKRVLLAWSSGKDCAWALHILRQQVGTEVAALLTTFNEAEQAASMHSVPLPLVEQQAHAAGLPLWPVALPWPCPNDTYESRMAEVCNRARQSGITAVAFGDLFLEDVRAYRERMSQSTNLQPLFPLWGLDTHVLARTMIASGQQAILTCVDSTRLPASFCGRPFDDHFLDDLPAGIDPCGENGEFHTFVHRSPTFRHPIPFRPGIAEARGNFIHAAPQPL